MARGLGEQVSAMEEERNSLKERLSSSETMVISNRVSSD